MEIKIVGQEPEAQQEEANPTSIIKDSEFLSQSVGQMFDLKPSEISQYGDKIDTLIRYAMTQTSDKTPEGVRWALRSLQGRVGTPPLGEKWVNYLSKYAYLSLESQKLTKDIEKYEHN